MADENKEGSSFRVTDRRGQAKEEPSPQPEPVATPRPKERPAAAPQPEQSGARGGITFANFILSMSTSSLMHMGYIEDPHTGTASVNLEMARQEIDLIEMLQAKTQGNLTDEEARMMEDILYELRLRFVEASKTPKTKP